MRAKKEYSNHFDFNMMKKFNLNFQARLLNVVTVFDTTKYSFRFEAFASKKKKIGEAFEKQTLLLLCSNVYISS